MSFSDSDKIAAILQKEKLNFADYLALLSPAAADRLEAMAQRASELTLKFFGRTILMYAPLYLNNECVNHCAYCGFSEQIPEKRVHLSIAEVEKEADILFQKGFRHILLVSGEQRDKVTIGYLKEVISRLHEKFDSISLEIFPLSEDEYRELFEAGADGLTIYQEVYDPDIYKKVHPRGPKSDYQFRLLTPERAAAAGFYRINIGALLGLGQWQAEAESLGRHAADLKKKFWRAQIAVSFPRLKTSAAGFQPINPVSDRQLTQLICALRIFQPSLGLVLSTREGKELRDNLMLLGITQMSAESKTSPGGYSNDVPAGEQFATSDKRSLEEVSAVIAGRGYEPVLKDWDKGYINE